MISLITSFFERIFSFFRPKQESIFDRIQLPEKRLKCVYQRKSGSWCYRFGFMGERFADGSFLTYTQAAKHYVLRKSILYRLRFGPFHPVPFETVD